MLRSYILKLSALGTNAQPLWGAMNAHQMIEHLSFVIGISNGKMKVQQVTPNEKLEKVRQFLFSDQPLPKNFRAPFLGEAPPPLRTASIADAITELEEEINAFEKYYEAGGENAVHPVFGPLSYDEWKHFHEKHFTHHLAQFGLIEIG